MKRWDTYYSTPGVEECAGGDYVLYEDHVRVVDEVRRDSRAASRVDALAMVRDVLHARSQDASPPTLADMVEWLDAEIRRGQS